MTTRGTAWISIGLLAFTLGPPARAARIQKSTSANSNALTWDERAVEHLLNRAGFGARPEEIDEGLKLGRDALVDRLLTIDEVVEPFFVERNESPARREMMEVSKDERDRMEKERRDRDRKQLTDYTAWWYDRMMSGRSPLYERMVLFWHGFFATAIEPGHRPYESLKQNQLLREHALGSYAKLLRAITADPAMLQYLDNQVNRKASPNENFARELMELFSLGEGHYTEHDVKEAARALTGRQERKGAYFFDKKVHDDGEKTILGVTGRLDGDDLVDILLKQEACARWVAFRVITHFEGVEPSQERVDRYASLLRKNDYEIKPLLGALFRDPAFYRDEVVGVRVLGPVEYMVGLTHRLSMRVPPVVLGISTTLLGQRLFAPPSVKGWEEGEAWITTASLMQRGNLAGLALGVVSVDAVFSQKDLEDAADAGAGGPAMAGGSMEGGSAGNGGAMDGARPVPPAAGDAAGTPMKLGDKLRKAAGQAGSRAGAGAYRALKKLELNGWAPSINFTARMQRAGATTDAQIVARMLDDLLAIRAPDDTHKKLAEYVARERALLDVRDGHLFDAGTQAEHLLRRLAHLILSLPEAQLG